MDALAVREKLKNNWFGRGLLRVLSWGYGVAVRVNAAAYKHGWKKVESANCRVVCIGNITAGGTGKTTAVLLAASLLAKAGLRVAIVSRGYKRQQQKGKNEVTILFDNPDADWRSAGDEPYMMSRVLNQYKVPILISRNRAAAANEALRRFKSQVILLDDGLQHHGLKRDVNIVLVDAKNPFGGAELLPLGNLREPLTGLQRASLVVLTHCDQVSEEKLKEIEAEISRYNSGVQILRSVHQPEYYFDVCEGKKMDLKAITGAAACFSALGHPETFEETLRRLGLDLKQVWRFADHAQYTEAHLQTFEQTRGGLPLVTTFKDFVKFPDNWRDILTGGIYVLSVNLKILGKDTEKDKFADVLYPDKMKTK